MLIPLATITLVLNNQARTPVSPSIDALQQTQASEKMQEVAADANRISSGGAPTMLIGNEAMGLKDWDSPKAI